MKSSLMLPVRTEFLLFLFWLYFVSISFYYIINLALYFGWFCLPPSIPPHLRLEAALGYLLSLLIFCISGRPSERPAHRALLDSPLPRELLALLQYPICLNIILSLVVSCKHAFSLNLVCKLLHSSGYLFFFCILLFTAEEDFNKVCQMNGWCMVVATARVLRWAGLGLTDLRVKNKTSFSSFLH